MRNLLLFAVLVAIALAFANPVAVHADHQPIFQDATNGTYDRFNPAIQEMRLTGVHRWRYVQEGSVNGLGFIAQALDEYSQEFGIFMQPDPAGYRQIASGGIAFVLGNSEHSACGGWAIGCVADFLTPKEAAVYDASTMASWPERSQVEVALHEDGHLLGNFAEGYLEDYVYGAGVNSCGGRSEFNLSIMGCGLGNAQFLGAFERGLWALSHGPLAPTAYGSGSNDGGEYLWWCNTDPKASRVALLAYTPATGAYRWTGRYAPASPSGCVGWHVSNWSLFTGAEVPCLNFENGASTKIGRNDTCSP